MIARFRLLLGLLAAPFRSKSSLEAENAALRQQLIVLRRKLRGRVRLSSGDRLFFVWLYRLYPSISRVTLIIENALDADAIKAYRISWFDFRHTTAVRGMYHFHTPCRPPK